MKHKLFLPLAVIVLLTITAPFSSAVAAEEVIGSSETLLTAMNLPGARGEECPLGDVAADALIYVSGADAALIPGDVFRFNLLGGDVTRGEILLIFPDEDPLATAELTAAQLWKTLENSVSALTVGANDRVDWDRSLSDGFLQTAGLRFRFDVSDPPGERVKEVVLDDGRVLDPADTGTLLTVVSTEALFTGRYGFEPHAYHPLDMTIDEAFVDYLSSLNAPVARPEADRIEMIGSADSAFLNDAGTSAVLFLVCAGVIALTGFLTFGRSPAWKALKNRVMPETEEEKQSVLNRFFRH